MVEKKGKSALESAEWGSLGEKKGKNTLESAE
jgi:hypothetical protein